MSEQQINLIPDDLSPDKIRHRIEVEDGLLNSRSTIFLGINGLWVAAVGVSSDQYLRAGVALLGILVSLLWLICSWQSQLVIASLTKTYQRLHSENQLEKIVQTELKGFGWLRPTNILASLLPCLFVVTWIIVLWWVSHGS
jgi:hypothetical protein